MTSAILLAAGTSSRMGSKNKLLLPFGNKPLIVHMVQKLLTANIDELIVVTGHEAPFIRKVLEAYPLSYVYNEAFLTGMSSSIKAGVCAADKNTQGFLICLSDMPLLQNDDYNHIIHHIHGARQIILPFYNGQKGNPVFFSHHFKEEILNNDFPEGCRNIVRKNATDITKVEMPNHHVLRDMDAPEDYAALKWGQE